MWRVGGIAGSVAWTVEVSGRALLWCADARTGGNLADASRLNMCNCMEVCCMCRPLRSRCQYRSCSVEPSLAAVALASPTELLLNACMLLSERQRTR